MPCRPLLAALLATCAVLAAAGCGGDADEKNAYVDRVATAQREYADRFATVLRGLTATSTFSEDRRTLEAFGAASTRFASALRGIEAPADVRQEHGRLLDAVQRYERRVTDARAALTDDEDVRARVRTTLSSDVESTQREVTKAIGDVNAALRDG